VTKATTYIEQPTAMSMAEKFAGQLRKKLVEIGNLSVFRDYFVSCYWDELPNEELTADKIQAAVNFLERTADN
jgi:hypothetical protein